MATTLFLRDYMGRRVQNPGTTATDFSGRLTLAGDVDYSGRKLIGKTWAISTAFLVGDYMQQTAGGSPLYQCTVAGSTLGSGTGPTAPGYGNTVTDGTVTWRQVSTT